MRHLAAVCLLFSGIVASQSVLADCAAILQHEMPALRSKDTIDLCERYAGKPLLIVNTASFCGFTPQFKGLEAIYQLYRGQGLAVLGVPSNDFRQEAAEVEKVADVCYVNYGVTFAMTDPQTVTGPGAHPVYRQLAEAAGEAPAWNFHKYLIDREGRVTGSFASQVAPDDPALVKAIELAL
ncbi:glutathione peroxidase [Halopseudomonas sp.]|uniref:glutathione peroxidase n=1 Tax=Halopseudomonas sp. TaxID=2901191 RepID=UPI003566E940